VVVTVFNLFFSLDISGVGKITIWPLIYPPPGWDGVFFFRRFKELMMTVLLYQHIYF
jgi:hypothetical protein